MNTNIKPGSPVYPSNVDGSGSPVYPSVAPATTDDDSPGLIAVAGWTLTPPSK